ncbi:MAG: RnfABCDGE type electron transport complex subunit B [Eubacterium sp.]|nr:RnfABCDGE type electron transport complex subunit B [Eubacterium sp.]
MSITAVIIAAVIVAVVGIVIGFFLGFSSEKFKVEVDPKEEAVLDVLPGNNCGGCGYAGCSGLAAAIAKGEAEITACPVGGDPVAAQIGEIMGIEAETGDKMVAFVKCAGDCDKAKVNYNYFGVESCDMMKFVPGGGPKKCDYGCLGYGECVDVCPFDAIHIVNGVAVVDKDECKACKKCITACPQNLIELVPYKAKYRVHCSSKDKGKDVMQSCEVGCIGCKLCEKSCHFDAVHVVDNIAYIDQDLCKGCGLCAKKCPKKIIY